MFVREITAESTVFMLLLILMKSNVMVDVLWLALASASC